MEFKYANEYGKLTLATVSEEMKISDICSDIVPKIARIDIDIAEKVTLITDNDRASVSFAFPGFMFGYICKNTSKSTAYICKLVSMEFDDTINPTAEIERCKSRSDANAIKTFTGRQ